MTTPTTNNESKIKDGTNNEENLSFDSNEISSDEQFSQKLDSINFSTTYEDKNNIYEREAKSLTTTSRTYAQVVRGDKLVKKPETPAENPKENKQTNETQQIQPIVGKIYKFRYSLHELFGIHNDGSSSVASSSKSKKPKKSPCLVIGKSSESFNILVITTFYGLHPSSQEVLPQLPKENLLKYILSIHPTSPILGNRSIKTTLSQSTSYFNPSEKYYIILKPVTFPLQKEWPTPLPDYIDNDELIYIRYTLLNILIQERNQPIGKSEIIQNNSEESDNATSSSSTSSVRTARFLQKSFEHIDLSLNKSQQIEKWLADVKSSSECVIDLNN